MVPANRFKSLSFLIFLFALIVTACSGSETKADSLKMSSAAELPAEVRASPLIVQQPTSCGRQPDAEPDPCYCGCGAMGRTPICLLWQDRSGWHISDNHTGLFHLHRHQIPCADEGRKIVRKFALMFYNLCQYGRQYSWWE
jgi:hypothetical protein